MSQVPFDVTIPDAFQKDGNVIIKMTVVIIVMRLRVVVNLFLIKLERIFRVCLLIQYLVVSIIDIYYIIKYIIYVILLL